MATTRCKDERGNRYFRLMVVERAGCIRADAAWLCECDCGQRKVVPGRHLRGGQIKSCGCWQFEKNQVNPNIKVKHGHDQRAGETAEYRAWQHMLRRCDPASRTNFQNYAARGITVCERWRYDFSAFLADVGPRPSPSHSIDRINNNGNYEPGNVRWATRSQQNQNTRGNKLNETSVREIRRRWSAGGNNTAALAREFGVSSSTIWRVVTNRQWRDLPEPDARARLEAEGRVV